MNRGSFLRRVGGALALVALDPRALLDKATETPAAVASAASLGRDVIVASGGLCTPITPFYSLPVRPIRDALPNFSARREGLTYERTL